jgi:hypothetical protein
MSGPGPILAIVVASHPSLSRGSWREIPLQLMLLVVEHCGPVRVRTETLQRSRRAAMKDGGPNRVRTENKTCSR